MSAFGSLARGTLGLMTPAVRAVGAVAPRTSLMLGAAAVSFGAAAGVAAMGAAYGVNRVASTLGGGNVFEGTTHEVLGYNVPGVPKLTRGLQWAAGIGGLGAGVAAGAYKAMGGGWNVNHAISTGMMEVERPHFLGATGSLTIASSRRGRGRMQDPGIDYSRMAAIYGDDAFHLIRAVAGH